MFEITYLGTSASAPSIQRGMPSLIVIHNEHRFMVDCGEGTQRQLLTSGIGLKKLNKFLFTHGHLDHILGFGGLVSTMAHWETMDEINVYGGGDSIERLRELLFSIVLRGNSNHGIINLNRLQEGVFFEDASLQVSCFPVTHRGTDSFGFRFEEKGRRPFLADKAAELGVPVGSVRKLLANGEDVTLDDGRLIRADDVLGDYKPGTAFVVVGDTGNAEELTEYVRGADSLSIESTYIEEDADMAKTYSHLTAKMAAQLAADAGVKTLYLTHFSRRCREKEILAEAQSIFPNTIAARDFSHYEISSK